jgi:hypothetical protein
VYPSGTAFTSCVMRSPSDLRRLTDPKIDNPVDFSVFERRFAEGRFECLPREHQAYIRSQMDVGKFVVVRALLDERWLSASVS